MSDQELSVFVLNAFVSMKASLSLMASAAIVYLCSVGFSVFGFLLRRRAKPFTAQPPTNYED